MAEELDLPWCFDDEHLAWQKTIQEFCQRVVAPGLVQRDLEGRFDPDLIREVGRLGAFGRWPSPSTSRPSRPPSSTTWPPTTSGPSTCRPWPPGRASAPSG